MQIEMYKTDKLNLNEFIRYYNLSMILNNELEWNGEIYQYFIIPESEVYYWEKYTSYPILYDDSTDIYLLGITHYGMSWSFFFTDADRPEYMKIKKYDEILKARAATAEGGK